MTYRAKHERIVEAVRQGLEGDAAVEFLSASGFPVNTASIVRNLRLMGGRHKIQLLIDEGKSNTEVLQAVFPEEPPETFPIHAPRQEELFHQAAQADATLIDTPLYDTTKITLRLPTDVYEAVRIAARVEHKNQNQVIVDILTAALARMPAPEN
jgi:hypothetical protein